MTDKLDIPEIRSRPQIRFGTKDETLLALLRRACRKHRGVPVGRVIKHYLLQGLEQFRGKRWEGK